MLSYACRLTCGDADWAEDVVQETYLRAWQRQELMTPEYGPVRGWLMRVAHNLVMDGYRSARMRRGELPLDEAGARAVDLATRTDARMTPLATARIRMDAGFAVRQVRRAVDKLLDVGGASRFAESSPA